MEEYEHKSLLQIRHTTEGRTMKLVHYSINQNISALKNFVRHLSPYTLL